MERQYLSKPKLVKKYGVVFDRTKRETKSCRKCKCSRCERDKEEELQACRMRIRVFNEKQEHKEITRRRETVRDGALFEVFLNAICRFLGCGCCSSDQESYTRIL